MINHVASLRSRRLARAGEERTTPSSPARTKRRPYHVADAASRLWGPRALLCHAHFYENTSIFYWDTPILGASRI
jgi:hypothetical protein